MIPILDGYRIIDLTAVILGPYGAQILGDLGADVIKVESPDGDNMRPISPTAAPGMSALFANNNRNKRSVVLDLKSAAGKRALVALIKTADILVHNMRQDALDKLGFGFDAVRAIKPDLIYCAAVGFGRDGPYAGRPAYDDVIQAASGLAGLSELRDGTPVYAPSIIADKVTGLHLAYAVLAAVLQKERKGTPPGYVEIPMFETMVAFNLNEHLSGATWGDDGSRGYQRAVARDRRPYQTKDSWVAVLPYTPAHWARVLKELGHGDVVESAWFKDPTERSRNFDKLYGILAKELPKRTTEEWLAVFDRLDVPNAPVRSPTDLIHDPHLAAVDFFTPNFGSPTPVKRTLRAPVVFGDIEVKPDKPPPMLGADTEALLREVGLDAADIAEIVGARGKS
ncbi:MAG TPA: CoA transferase [Hyphomicrobiaceae bacterium]|nr:CoA transferase [Hyphomicrobiaceae bacterium]